MESIGVRLSLWPSRGWVPSVFITEETTDTRYHYILEGLHLSCEQAAEYLCDFLMMYGSWGLGTALQELIGWTYVPDRESAAASAAASHERVQQQDKRRHHDEYGAQHQHNNADDEHEFEHVTLDE